MRRRSWHETWMSVAEDVARRSVCVRDAVGAVIVDPTNRIVATGYNGPPAGFTLSNRVEGCLPDCKRAYDGPSSPCYDDCISIHAEANALMFCDRRDREGGAIYVSSAICYTCAKLISNSGISRVVLRVGHDVEHRDPLRSVTFMRMCKLDVMDYAMLIETSMHDD